MLRAIAAVAILSPVAAQAVPIDLNLLYRDPGAPISIATDGSSATFSEDPAVFAVFLSNIPGLGDPELVAAAAGAKLAFDYSFVEAPDNADIFHFALLDGVSGSALPLYELFVSSSGAGAALFDLSSLLGTSLGLQFELIPDIFSDLGFESRLTISNLRIETERPGPTPVSEPGSLALLLLGLSSTTLLNRGRRFRARTAFGFR
jgi:hypothetical protein